MKNWIILLVFGAVIGCNFVNALDVTAESCSREDVQSAAGQVEEYGGGSVFIPAGDCVWDSYVIVSGPVSFIGAGYEATIIRKPDGGYIFYHTDVGSFVRYNSLGFYGGDASASKTTQGIYIASADNFRIDNNKWYASTWHSPIVIKRCTKGIIDHNIFNRLPDWTSNYGIQLGQNSGMDCPCPASHTIPYALDCAQGASSTCQDYDDPQCYDAWNQWWDLTSNNNGNEFLEDFPAGSDKMIYVEDNVFNWYGPSVEGNWGNKMAVCFRFNTVNSIKGSTGFAVKPGGQWAEAYGNVFTCVADGCEADPQGTGAYFRTSGLFYNNTLVNYNTGGIFAAYYCSYGYCYTDQALMDETYVFDNTYINVDYPGDDTNGWREWSEGSPERIAENENYFFRAPQPGDRIYPYTPYTYPHPLATQEPEQNCSEKGGTECCASNEVCDGTNLGTASDCLTICCTGTCIVDSIPPVISNVVSTPSSNSAEITWTTNEQATSKVDYGLTTSYGSAEQDLSYKTSHSITLTDLNPETTYYYMITSSDPSGNSATQTGSFSTLSYAGWQSPVSVHSSCGGNPEVLIDGDTETTWGHWTTEAHWVVLDLGASYDVQSLRHYHNQWTTTNAIAEIFVSENTADWGSSLGSLPGYSREGSGWKEVDIMDKQGRYIRLETPVVASPYWREIEAYVSDSSPSTCQSGADHPPYDNSISISELIAYIDKWKNGAVTINQVIEAIGEWKSGCQV